MREAVFVQLGGYSNFVGSHFWNLQDESLAQQPPPGSAPELSLTPFFRESYAGSRQTSYAPRLQIVDLSGSYGALSPDSGLVRHSEGPTANPVESIEQNPDDASLAWSGRTQRYERAQTRLNKYQLSLEKQDAEEDATQAEDEMTGISEDFGLDWNVNYWSDYTKVRFHQKTCYELAGLHAGVQPFSAFDDGVNAASLTVLEDVYEGLRFFVEECDHLTGIVVTCDVFGGFSGFNEKYVSFLRDELGAALPIMEFGSTSEPAPDRGVDAASLQRILAQGRLNEALLTSSLSELHVQYVPLRARASQSMPYLHPALVSDFQTSAVLGSAIDVLLTPLRMSTSPSSLGVLVNSLQSFPSAFLSGAGLAMPVFQPLSYRRSAVLELDGMTRLSTPLPDPTGKNLAKQTQERLSAELVIGRGARGAFPCVCNTETRVAIPVPFPRFFDGRIGMTGSLAPETRERGVQPDLTEVGELSSVGAIYTDGCEGSAALHSYSTALKQAALSHVQGNVESETFSTASELMLAAAQDYDDLRR